MSDNILAPAPIIKEVSLFGTKFKARQLNVEDFYFLTEMNDEGIKGYDGDLKMIARLMVGEDKEANLTWLKSIPVTSLLDLTRETTSILSELGLKIPEVQEKEISKKKLSKTIDKV